jgi:hypothetical protein
VGECGVSEWFILFFFFAGGFDVTH